MVDLASENGKMIDYLVESGSLKTSEIIEAIKNIPRHHFVKKEDLEHAYINEPLSLFDGQTISQPYTVAVMIEALEPKKWQNILEIGTGSGWTASLLSHVVGDKGKVTTIDIFPKLVDFAKKNIKKMSLKNIEAISGDGKLGHKRNAPYDRVLINAACNEVPREIMEQTKINGKIVAPVNAFYAQRMTILDKVSKNKFKKEDLGSFIFVPLL